MAHRKFAQYPCLMSERDDLGKEHVLFESEPIVIRSQCGEVLLRCHLRTLLKTSQSVVQIIMVGAESGRMSIEPLSSRNAFLVNLVDQLDERTDVA